MKLRVGINGFGRIGRSIFRAGFAQTDVEFVGINDVGDSRTMAHLLKYDSIHGKFSHEVDASENHLKVEGKEIPISKERDPADIPWGEWKADIVFECVGIFRTYELASKHLDGGAKRVILSAPDKGKTKPIPVFVYGVNEDKYDSENHKIISNASCTTNCYAPVTKLIDESFTVKSGYMTTIHSYTTDQRLLDLPHGDLRRARSAALSMIPTSTGAAKAVGKVLPHLEGKLQAMSIRVPTPNVSLIDAVYSVKKEVTKEEVNQVFVNASLGEMKDILAVSKEELVSSDYNGNPYSATVDLPLTMASDNQIKIIAWYDNETGYSSRMIDLARYISSKED
ncbi:MAG: type I glyceraldehyde-3-phosphate dehydrogenase [Candidatus Heimdallarchaeota archaeon]|nr:type I glyceraldehyde-3-phosphate dehydrogenase [Candidatus Heimdallarchaeota archaeon]MCK4877120.1 type I glyceraldehyde-3-phosphate dehydrogenase [Candidatus Heimdallarchaeota archaeon]